MSPFKPLIDELSRVCPICSESAVSADLFANLSGIQITLLSKEDAYHDPFYILAYHYCAVFFESADNVI